MPYDTTTSPELNGHPVTNKVMAMLEQGASGRDLDLLEYDWKAMAEEATAQMKRQPATPAPARGVTEFLTSMEFDIPAGMRPEALTVLYAAETDYAVKEIAAGTIARLWRLPGTRGNFILWRVADATELHAHLSGLPLWRFVTNLQVYPVAHHPMDPGMAPSPQAVARARPAGFGAL